MAPPDPRRRHGRHAELLAAWWLRWRGWSVLARNRRLAGVEVDLLVRRGRLECLIEVKSRRLRSGPLPRPEALVGPRQLSRLARAARARAAFRPGLLVRVDLVVVRFGGGLPRLSRFEGLDSRSEVE